MPTEENIEFEAAMGERYRYLAAFRADSSARNIRREYNFRGEKLLILPNVFPSDSPLTYGARGITEAIDADMKFGKLHARSVKSAIDVGTGCGVLLTWLARTFPARHLLGIDIDLSALENARCNSPSSRVRHCDVQESDLFCRVSNEFDLVVASLPMTVNYQECDEIDYDTLKRFCAQLPTHLVSGGRAYVAWASWADLAAAEAIIHASQLHIAHYHTHPEVGSNCYWRTYVLELRKAC